MTGNWKNWGDERYADTLYRRAVGVLPEMDSSKSAARRIKALWKAGDNILDIGCGAGHYLISLRREMGLVFDYYGVDITVSHLAMARKAFSSDARASFAQGDIFALPYADTSFDIVTCNNLLQNFPAIARPLLELVRVTRKVLIVRFLCGDRTYLIRDVHPCNPELDASGEPYEFNFYNIYSKRYVSQLLSKIDGIAEYRIEPDLDFSPQNLGSDLEDGVSPKTTKVIGNLQVNGYILLPWAFLTVLKRP